MEFGKKQRRVTGFELPASLGGLQWDTQPGEREVLERLVIELAAKRALSKEYEWEDEEYLNLSVIEIRGFLTEALHGLRPGKLPYRLVEQLRADCNNFLTIAGRPQPGSGLPRLREHVQEALGELRESFRVKLAYLAKEGQLAGAGELAGMIPDRLSPEGPIGRELRTGVYRPKVEPVPKRRPEGKDEG